MKCLPGSLSFQAQMFCSLLLQDSLSRSVYIVTLYPTQNIPQHSVLLYKGKPISVLRIHLKRPLLMGTWFPPLFQCAPSTALSFLILICLTFVVRQMVQVIIVITFSTSQVPLFFFFQNFPVRTVKIINNELFYFDFGAGIQFACDLGHECSGRWGIYHIGKNCIPNMVQLGSPDRSEKKRNCCPWLVQSIMPHIHTFTGDTISVIAANMLTIHTILCREYYGQPWTSRPGAPSEPPKTPKTERQRCYCRRWQEE